MSGALPVLEESLDPDKAESELLKERIMNLMELDTEKAAGAFSLWLRGRTSELIRLVKLENVKYEDLKGFEKAAILINYLGRGSAKKLFNLSTTVTSVSFRHDAKISDRARRGHQAGAGRVL